MSGGLTKRLKGLPGVSHLLRITASSQQAVNLLQSLTATSQRAIKQRQSLSNLLLHIRGNSAQAAMQLQLLRELAVEDYVNHRLLTLPSYQDPKRLSRHEQQTYSQGGEDGVIAEIFDRIGTTNNFFVEFGVENGLQNNTLCLLLQGWRGCWIEGDEPFTRDIRKLFATQIDDGQLALKQALVTAENVENLFAALDVAAEFDLLSIDIDGNDYWVWNALEQFRPRVVVIEYNASFPPPIRCVKKYDARNAWNGTSYFGASLKSLELLGRSKGYNLVGCSLTGANAFFVRADVCADQFAAPYTAENHYEPPRYFLMRQVGHRPGFGEFENI